MKVDNRFSFLGSWQHSRLAAGVVEVVDKERINSYTSVCK